MIRKTITAEVEGYSRPAWLRLVRRVVGRARGCVGPLSGEESKGAKSCSVPHRSSDERKGGDHGETAGPRRASRRPPEVSPRPGTTGAVDRPHGEAARAPQAGRH